MTTFLSELGTKLADRWAAAILAPGLLFLGALSLATRLGQGAALHAGRISRWITQLAAAPASHSTGAILVIAAGTLGASTAIGLIASALGRLVERAWLLRGDRGPGRILRARRERRWNAADERVRVEEDRIAAEAAAKAAVKTAAQAAVKTAVGMGAASPASSTSTSANPIAATATAPNLSSTTPIAAASTSPNLPSANPVAATAPNLPSTSPISAASTISNLPSASPIAATAPKLPSSNPVAAASSTAPNLPSANPTAAAATRPHRPRGELVLPARSLAEAIARRDAVSLVPPERPTWIADRLRAVDVRVWRTYSLDLQSAWPRLWSIAGPDLRSDLGAAQDSYAAAARLTGWGLLYSGLGLWWWPAAVVGVAALGTAWVRARAAAGVLAELVETTVDLHLRDLARRLDLDDPDLVAAGAAVTDRLRKRRGSRGR
ncbi:hypothetical protein GCM10009839_61030 [Catenulispora yoronensis]|uniref:Vegetative cell wall protein gp1 n=1 Tax=Catenulispora yoronensis TaxID=450799 RepID=A0ABP5GLI6_9ACTN